MAARRGVTQSKRVRSSRVAPRGGERIQEVLLASVAALESEGARYCLAGGIARAYLAEPRSTKDIDFAVSVASDEEAEQLLFRLQRGRFVVRELFQKVTGRIATARLTLGAVPIRVDLLFLTSGLEDVAVRESVRVELVRGVEVSLIRRPHLIAMKVVAYRPQDLVDIAALLDAGTAAEEREVTRILENDSRAAVLMARWDEVLRLRREWTPDLVPDARRMRAIQKRIAKKPIKKR